MDESGRPAAAPSTTLDAALLGALKVLSDASRLRIVGLLADGRRMPVADLAAALGLTPGTVVHHLKRLADAGLVESRPRPPFVDYSLRLGRLAEIGATLDALARQQAGAEEVSLDAPPWASAEQARVLHAFFDGARLTSIPAQHAKRLVVLRQLAETAFEPDHEYVEKDVNMRLALRHPDVASLRRYLVDERFMTRHRSVYRLNPPADWPI
jgi:DNA-binding transcriptional ArsR family regulator